MSDQRDFEALGYCDGVEGTYGLWLRTKRCMERQIPDPKYGYVSEEEWNDWEERMARDVRRWWKEGVTGPCPDPRIRFGSDKKWPSLPWLEKNDGQ